MRIIVQVPNKPNIFVVCVKDSSDCFDIAETNKLINEVAKWCKETFENEYETWNFEASSCTFMINKEEDIIAFKLRWM